VVLASCAALPDGRAGIRPLPVSVAKRREVARAEGALRPGAVPGGSVRVAMVGV
jgi:hypothetical protein